jgi:hypothetical protein
MIILAAADKPLARSAKGTSQRGMTIKLFNGEIDEIYERTDSGAR